MILDLIDEGADINTHGASLLAGAIGTFHASGCFGECFFFCVDPVVEASGPILVEVSFRNSFKFDFMLMPILLPGLCVNNLRFIEMGSSRKYLLIDLLRILGDGKPIHSASNNLSEHMMCKIKI